jgi:hypothetical protein
MGAEAIRTPGKSNSRAINIVPVRPVTTRREAPRPSASIRDMPRHRATRVFVNGIQTREQRMPVRALRRKSRFQERDKIVDVAMARLGIALRNIAAHGSRLRRHRIILFHFHGNDHRPQAPLASQSTHDEEGFADHRQ